MQESKKTRALSSAASHEPLLPERHPDSDIFICDIADAAIKDDMASMEHPVFVLTKQPYLKRRRYQNGDYWLEIAPSDKGIANIWDKDILIYAISQIMAAKNAGKPYQKHVSFTAYNFLVFSNRNTGGKDYTALKDSLERLKGTQLITNVITGDVEQIDGFSLIDKFRIRRLHADGRVIEWGITLSDWVFNAIESNEVLTLSSDYFRLKKPLERRLYEVARKHCGNQPEWRISLDLLLKKCGSSSPKRNFKTMLKQVAERDYLPDYAVQVINDTVCFTLRKKAKKATDKITLFQPIPPLQTRTYEDFKALYHGYDPYEIEARWRDWAMGKPCPNNPDKAFLAFAKKHIERPLF